MAPPLDSSPFSKRSSSVRRLSALETVDVASWYCFILILPLVLFTILPYNINSTSSSTMMIKGHDNTNWRRRPCDEIYMVSEGETLQTISDKCGDPFIVERNPHIHDPDDVFPGFVIKVTPVLEEELILRG